MSLPHILGHSLRGLGHSAVRHVLKPPQRPQDEGQGRLVGGLHRCPLHRQGFGILHGIRPSLLLSPALPVYHKPRVERPKVQTSAMLSYPQNHGEGRTGHSSLQGK